MKPTENCFETKARSAKHGVFGERRVPEEMIESNPKQVYIEFSRTIVDPNRIEILFGQEQILEVDFQTLLRLLQHFCHGEDILLNYCGAQIVVPAR
jgi:hypothetical protein